jgi:hypothetical protein
MPLGRRVPTAKAMRANSLWPWGKSIRALYKRGRQMFSKMDLMLCQKLNKILSSAPMQSAERSMSNMRLPLRSENARLKDIAERNAKTEAQNQEIRKKNSEFLQRENIKLQAHLLASQDRVYELQTELLRVREIINSA